MAAVTLRGNLCKEKHSQTGAEPRRAGLRARGLQRLNRDRRRGHTGQTPIPGAWSEP